jgi:hypothetical protein
VAKTSISIPQRDRVNLGSDVTQHHEKLVVLIDDMSKQINPSYVVADGEETSPSATTRFSLFPLTFLKQSLSTETAKTALLRFCQSLQIDDCVTSVRMINNFGDRS